MSSRATRNKPNPLLADNQLRSFGRLAARMSPEAQEALEQKLAPLLLAADKPVDLSIFPQQGRLFVELGAGMGDQILVRAKQNPADRFIACEVYRNGLRDMAAGAEQHGLQNLRFFAEDGRKLLDLLPPQSIDMLMVLYPDPWHKRRHHKRRIIQTAFLDQVAKVLKPGGQLLLATDITSYALWMLERLLPHKDFIANALAPAEWATPPQGWVATKYERKARREGRQTWYFTFTRK